MTLSSQITVPFGAATLDEAIMKTPTKLEAAIVGATDVSTMTDVA